MRREFIASYAHSVNEYYWAFLTDGFMVKWPWYFYDITTDNYSFREGRVADP
jgi:hypothetical protein